MKYMEFRLEGLNCASCALKIQESIRTMDNVDSVVVNFMEQSLKITLRRDPESRESIARIKQIISSIEPHVKVIESDVPGNVHNSVWDGVTLRKEFFFAGISVLLLIIGMKSDIPLWATTAIMGISYLLAGWDVLLHAVKNIVQGRVFDENLLMGIATIGAFIIGEYPEAVAVMLFYKVGEVLQNMAVDKSRRSIKSLINIRPDYANLKTEKGFSTVDPASINIGDVILVKPGERVPLDGVVIEGRSEVDTSALTGEFMPQIINTGDSILSGSINKNAILQIRVTKTFKESTVSRILDLVQNSASKKAVAENFITKFARYYTPLVVTAALFIAVFPPIFSGSYNFADWIYKALVFLVISCPCALVISIPLSFFGGIGSASSKGILVKGGNYLEALNSVKTVVFDKTGTLTKGVFRATEVVPANGFSREDLLKYTALAEAHSSHPIAKSILEAYGKPVDQSAIKSYEEIAGHGIKAVIEGKVVLAGNDRLLHIDGCIQHNTCNVQGTVAHVAIDHVYAGYIKISDEIKEDAAKTIAELKLLGVTNTVMLSGDSRKSVESVSSKLDIDKAYWELLPQQKVEKLEELQSEPGKGKLAYVGDGINDAPVLARADIGIAMGALGSDAAIEASDIVLMTDEPYKLVEAISIARKTRKIVWQNIILALGVKLAVLILGTVGIATMWEAVFADVGVALLAVLNALRILKR
ncbi:MAG: heavy metal translocating P-type ATPase [Acetivibrionales bacterium]